MPSCGGPKQIKAEHCIKCAKIFSHKGKSYEEIYGTSSPNCGFKKGKDNVAKNPFIKKKIKEGVLKSYQNPELLQKRIIALKKVASKEKGFRSKQEEDFSIFLESCNIEYVYEKPLQYITISPAGLCCKRSKLVDFYLPFKNIYIELTGFIWGSGKKEAQEFFKERMLQLASENPDNIYIISSDSLNVIDKVKECFLGYYPWNMVDMKPGNNLIIFTLEDLKSYIRKEFI